MRDANSVSFTKVLLVPCEKLIGSTSYNIWDRVVETWFHGQGFEDHLTPKLDVVAADKLTKWKQIDASLCTVLWYSIAPNLQAQYQAFTTCYEVWEKAKKVFSNVFIVYTMPPQTQLSEVVEYGYVSLFE